MKAYRHIGLSFLLFGWTLASLAGSQPVSAQSGMTFKEFRSKLQLYFADDLIADLPSQLPQGAEYRIWGWDVADFSGDGYNDVAFAVRVNSDRKKQVQVYLFVDDEGYLSNVATYPYPFVDLPLEVGVVIKEQTCFVTRKRAQFSWVIRGYRYDQGSVVLVDEFTTARIDKFTKETYRNYQSLESSERLLSISSGKPEFTTKYLTIPCYERGRPIYRGYQGAALSRSVDFVTKGAFYWSGETDCSFTTRASYDQTYLYMTVAVRDDNVVEERCDTCTGDYVDIWFDVNPPPESGDRIFVKPPKKKLTVRQQGDSGIYCVSVRIGNFADKAPWASIRTTDDVDADRQTALSSIKVSASLRDRSYIVKARIPFSILGFDAAPGDEQSITELGCTVQVHDSDNEFRPEEETIIGTSSLEPFNPSSYGALVFVPKDKWYGETTNLLTESVLRYLSEMGF